MAVKRAEIGAPILTAEDMDKLDRGLFLTFAFGNPEPPREGPGELLDFDMTDARPARALPAPSIIIDTNSPAVGSQFGSADDLLEE